MLPFQRLLLLHYGGVNGKFFDVTPLIAAGPAGINTSCPAIESAANNNLWRSGCKGREMSLEERSNEGLEDEIASNQMNGLQEDETCSSKEIPFTSPCSWLTISRLCL